MNEEQAAAQPQPEQVTAGGDTDPGKAPLWPGESYSLDTLLAVLDG